MQVLLRSLHGRLHPLDRLTRIHVPRLSIGCHRAQHREIGVLSMCQVKGGEASGCLHCIVACDLCCHQMLVPIRLSVVHVCAQHVLYCSVRSLCLSVCLWV